MLDLTPDQVRESAGSYRNYRGSIQDQNLMRAPTSGFDRGRQSGRATANDQESRLSAAHRLWL